MVTLETLKLVSLFGIDLLFPTPTLPKSMLVLARTTESLTPFCWFPSSWQPVSEMRAAAIRKEPRLVRPSNLAFKVPTSVQPYLTRTAGDFRVARAVKTLLQPPLLSRPRLRTRRLRKDYTKCGIGPSTMVRDLSLDHIEGTVVLWRSRRKDNGGVSIGTGPLDPDLLAVGLSAQGFLQEGSLWRRNHSLNLGGVTAFQVIIVQRSNDVVIGSASAHRDISVRGGCFEGDVDARVWSTCSISTVDVVTNHARGLAGIP